jgi:hypothetical protein
MAGLSPSNSSLRCMLRNSRLMLWNLWGGEITVKMPIFLCKLRFLYDIWMYIAVVVASQSLVSWISVSRESFCSC